MQMQPGSVFSVSPSSPSLSTHSSSRRLAEIAARVVEEDDDFEFAFVCRDPEMSPVSADDIFYNGQIKPTYPVFDTSLLNNIDQTPNVKPRSRRLPLIELMSEEREPGELDRVTPGTYCVWTPKSETLAKIDTGRYDESDSSGTLSTKRWKLKDLIYTSNRDGQCGSNRDVKAGDMRRSLMPNSKLVGIFSNINGLSRSLHPF